VRGGHPALLGAPARGLGIIVSEASYGSISTRPAVWLGIAVLVVYVTVSGVHGSAWTAVVKDRMTSGGGGLGIYFPSTITAAPADVRGDEAAKPLPQLPPGDEPLVVRLHRAAERHRVLHVAPHVRLLVHAKNESVFRKNAW